MIYVLLYMNINWKTFCYNYNNFIYLGSFISSSGRSFPEIIVVLCNELLSSQCFEMPLYKMDFRGNCPSYLLYISEDLSVGIREYAYIDYLALTVFLWVSNLEASKPKWVNSNDIQHRVKSLMLRGLHSSFLFYVEV